MTHWLTLSTAIWAALTGWPEPALPPTLPPASLILAPDDPGSVTGMVNARLIAQGLMTGGILLLAFASRWLSLRLITRHVDSVEQRYRLRKLSSYLIITVALFIAGNVWLGKAGIDALATYLGIISAGIAIALRDILLNLTAWVYIVWSKPFRVGDRIEIAGIRGDVVDQTPSAFFMLELGNWVAADQSTGRIISVPNAKVFIEPLANYTLEFSFIWLDLDVVVTFESDWERARALLQQIGEQHSADRAAQAEQQLRSASRMMIAYGTLTPHVYVNVVDHGVSLALRCLVEARGRRAVVDAIWRDFLTRTQDDPSIDLAYPTQRFYDHLRESRQSPAGPPIE